MSVLTHPDRDALTVELGHRAVTLLASEEVLGEKAIHLRALEAGS